jgi:dephospho-CoA kinase
MKRADALKRIKAQMPLKDKVRFADFVIDNNGSIKETRKQVMQIRRQLWKS